MSSGYFLSIAKEKVGPFTENDIVVWLKMGRITMFDMIFNQQTNEWVMLMQHPDFSDLEYNYVKEEPEKSVVGLIAEGSFVKPSPPTKTPVVSTEITLLKPLNWYLKSKPHEGLSYISILSLIKNKKVFEQTLIGKSPRGPWQKLIEWPDFSVEAREEFKKTSKVSLPDAHIRRKTERHSYGKIFVLLTKEKHYKVFCSDISRSGLGLIVRSDIFKLQEEVYVKFGESVKDNDFEAKAVVVSSRKVKLPGSDEVFIRYGVRFTHMNAAGKEFLSGLLPTAMAA